MTNKAEYYLKGFHIGEFGQNADLEAMLRAISEIHAGRLKSGFELKEKYKHTKDLKPDVYNYDPSFVNILFSNNIPALLKELVGSDLILTHLQLRISYPGGAKSYMIWHRDTHVYGGVQTGNIPPAHKLIFYPRAEGREFAKIRVAPGSHRRVFSSRILDYLQIFFSKKATINSSDSRFLLFNTELFHHVVPEKQTCGAFRLIYSFVDEENLKNYEGGEELVSLYKNKIKTL